MRKTLVLIPLVIACGPAPAPMPASSPPPASAPDYDPGEVSGSIGLATYCPGVGDKLAADWVRVDDTALASPRPGRCYLPWAEQSSRVFRPHSDAVGWVDLDLSQISASACLDRTPSPAQRQAMLEPDAIWVRLPVGAAGHRLQIRARSLGEQGWAGWRSLRKLDLDERRLFELPLGEVVVGAGSTVELAVAIEGTGVSETALVHWPTRC